MKFVGISLVTILSVIPAAHAQWEDDWNPWETETELGATLVLAPDADEQALGLGWVGVSTNRILENGLEIGVSGRLEAQKDHPLRAGFSGVPGGAEGAQPAFQGAFTGLAYGAALEEADLRAELEEAYVYVDGGYGELRLGRDEGVAARFQENAPSVFNALALGRQALDPTGIDIVTTRHDLTGPSAKLSYATPRLIGIRAGVSFTPKADVRGLDRDADRNLPGAAPITLVNAVEGSVNVSRLLREQGVRLSAALAASTAEVDTPPYAAPVYDCVSTFSAGARAEFETIALGFTWLQSDNGLTQSADYESWTAGVTKTFGKTQIGLEYGAAKDGLTALEGDAWKIGIAHDVTKHARFSLGYGENSLDRVASGANPAPQWKNSPDGIVIEITLLR